MFKELKSGIGVILLKAVERGKDGKIISGEAIRTPVKLKLMILELEKRRLKKVNKRVKDFKNEEGKTLEEIKAKMDTYKKAREEKQPIDMPSAGSTFKRGTNFISAQLIDEAGLKGYTIGGAQVSKKHAGFIVNTGNATAEDILNLIDHVIKVVYEKFGKILELEVEVIGE